MEIIMSPLFVIAYIGYDKELKNKNVPTVYPKIFTSREEAEKTLPHIGDGIIVETFINDK